MPPAPSRLPQARRITTESRLEAGWRGQHLAPGRFVALEVTDTGSGMDEATRLRIFEPFFTTKFTGRGLGLSAVMGILRGHRGAIRVTSAPGKGSTFKLLFPATTAPAQRLETAAREPSGLLGHGTILLVDDNEGIIRIARKILERLGFSVLTAANGMEAVDVYAAHATEIVCVLLDLTMPKMNGDEAFRRIRAINPDARVILSSGYGEQQAVRQIAGGGPAGFMQKPYLQETLAQKLREILGQQVFGGGTYAGKDPSQSS